MVTGDGLVIKGKYEPKDNEMLNLATFIGDIPNADEFSQENLLETTRSTTTDENDDIFDELIAISDTHFITQNNDEVDNTDQFIDEIFDELSSNESVSNNKEEIEQEENEITKENTDITNNEDEELFTELPVVEDIDIPSGEFSHEYQNEATEEQAQEEIQEELPPVNNEEQVQEVNITDSELISEISNVEKLEENNQQSEELETEEFLETNNRLTELQVDSEAFFVNTQEEDIEVTDKFYKDEEVEEEFVMNTEDIIAEEFFKEDITELDDSEPLVLANEIIAPDKNIYLIRHNGLYSVIGTVGEEVFILNKFDEPPIKENIILKFNEKRNNTDIYILKVGTSISSS